MVNEQHGTWGQARKFSRLVDSGVDNLTCVSPGNCLGVGGYANQEHAYPFSVTEKNGSWGTAHTFPRLMAKFDNAKLSDVSCGSRQKNGVWGSAEDVSGVATLSATTVSAELSALACWSAGNCSAIGLYDTTTSGQVFITSEKNGTWRPATDLKGLAALGGSPSSPPVLSCGAPGSCVLGGPYFAFASRRLLPYLATQKNGVWGNAHPVKGIDP